MQMVTENTFRATIWIAGDESVIKQKCREFCNRVGLCVTITPTLFVYTGGQEDGVQVGLLNYPRFPKTKEEVKHTAKELALELVQATHQHSCLVCADDETVWISIRDESKVAK